MLTVEQLKQRVDNLYLEDPEAEIFVYTGPDGTRVRAQSKFLSSEHWPSRLVLECPSAVPSAGGPAS